MKNFSIKDRYFYPLAAFFAAIMIVFALSFGEKIDLSEKEIMKNGYLMEGEDLVHLAMQPGTKATYISEVGTTPPYAELISTAARESLPPGPGIFAPLGPPYEKAFAKRQLRMTITARASGFSPLKEFDMGYFTAGSGDSGWKRRVLTSEWADYVMEFRPGALNKTQGLDHFSIWPGETSELLKMDVLKMRIEVLDAPN